MLEILTGTGLATAAGLNAYVPLLVLGALARWTDVITPPAGWEWLTNGWVLVILAVLLVVEVVADKVPVVDSVNDVVQTVVRPAAGGIAFGAGSGSQTALVADPGAFAASGRWLPVVLGIALALVVHGAKATARPIITATTLGVGGPVVSTVEDATSVGLSFAAILAPVLVILGLAALVLVWFRVRRRVVAARRIGSLRMRGRPPYGSVGRDDADPVSIDPQ
ncbi:MAG TPA: DUF4126 domain-containing protein [Cellulomonas sp.]|uniref:DUF4126 domain-containing protein n=1 Tax=Cellulomonas sp. TaxID=40001 RepID=UPI002E3399DB|nr:DUF4126 domain-containing protein [Cellulomonas sp.]HEX5332415.1 DUF4126 domain-containing protein [Cellulomonas sp.]